MSRRRNVPLAVLALLVLSAGCAGPSGGSNGKARQIRQASVGAIERVDTYELEMTMTATTTDGRSVEIAVHVVANRSSQRSKVRMIADTPRGSQRVTAYIIDGTGYVNAGGHWQTREINMSRQRDRFQRIREILETATVTFEGNTTVDGVPVSTLRLDIPDDKLDELVVLSARAAGDAAPAWQYTEFTYTLYVSRETYLPRKAEVDATARIRDQMVDIQGTIRYRGFGEPVSITLPAAAPGAEARAET